MHIYRYMDMDFVTEKYVKVTHVEYIKVTLHYNSVLFFL